MTDETNRGASYSPSSSASNGAGSSSYSGGNSGSTPYVRQPRPRASQGTINDFAPAAPVSPASSGNVKAGEPSYTHDSSFTLSGKNPIQSRSYRRARSEQAKVRQELKYGQYLSVPKGNREIFSSRERQSGKRKAVIAIIVVAIAIVLLLLFWPK